METKNKVPRTYLFSSESVTEGHPDKVCDQISDAVLDAHLQMDPQARVACEVLAAKDLVVIAGEITSHTHVDVVEIARTVLLEIGYNNKSFGIDASSCHVLTSLSQQSPDIARGVDIADEREQGAGDQGLMFGYACDETPELMPLAIQYAHQLAQRLAELRKTKKIAWLRPDGKSQVTVRYVDDVPQDITSVVISTQHAAEVDHATIYKTILEEVIKPVCGKHLTPETVFHINPTGSFIVGGPQGDTGLTGRKIIVDTYGGMGRHGGGCFSGKDPSKVDRSAAYMMRHVAKNVVAAGLAKRCEIQVAYSIGVAEPVSLYVNTFGTGTVDDVIIERAIRELFPLKPAELIRYLDLKRPIYQATAAYGHFGRNEPDFTWENTHRAEELKTFAKK
jgi:S-adenosylmethionine synthetase